VSLHGHFRKNTNALFLQALGRHLCAWHAESVELGIPVSRFFSLTFESPAHDRPPWQAAAKDKATQRHKSGDRIHPLLQPKMLDGNRPATDPSDHGVNQSYRPLACRSRRRHQYRDDDRKARRRLTLMHGDLVKLDATHDLQGAGIQLGRRWNAGARTSRTTVLKLRAASAGSRSFHVGRRIGAGRIDCTTHRVGDHAFRFGGAKQFPQVV